MRLYALHDSDPHLRETLGARPVNAEQAREKNAHGYGIFWVVNSYTARRKTSNLTRINWWFIELDGGDKADQEQRFKSSPLLPSLVVESANGYHAYWKAIGATKERTDLRQTWKRIVRWGLVPALGGDPKATDPLRLLRAPGYYHCKGEPFPVQVVWESSAAYTEAQMLEAFPCQEETRDQQKAEPAGDLSFWQRVAALDGRDALARLNGHWLQKGERFYLREQGNGNANIFREGDDYSTGCFVDADGRLGGVDGGSSVAAWCAWYGWSWGEVASGLREVFPELSEGPGGTLLVPEGRMADA